MKQYNFKTQIQTSYCTLPGMITHSLREAILSGELPGGFQLKQEELASKFNVSMSALREALKSLDAGCKLDRRFTGEPLPLLDQVFEELGGQFLINVELKNYTTVFDDLPVRVAQTVKSFDLMDTVFFSSFNPFNLPRLRKRLPDAKLGLLTLPEQARSWVWKLVRYDALHPYFDDVDEELVAANHARMKKVHVWTVDEPEDILRMAKLGVDSIITNFPLIARQALEV